MDYREALCQLLTEKLPAVKSGAEIGVHRGVTAQKLLTRFPKLKLHLVDAWSDRVTGDRLVDPMAVYNQDDHNRFYNLAMERTQPAAERRCVYRMRSDQAARTFQDTLDFVFIDANHSEEAVRDDLDRWAAHVRRGGLIICHDYEKPEFGVKAAVDAFAAHTMIRFQDYRGVLVWGRKKRDG